MTAVSAQPAAAVSLEDLVSAIAAGDRQAFADFYHLLQARVRSRAFAIIRCRGLAEEIVQEVFLEIWRKASNFDPGKGAATTWTWQLTRARSIDRVRTEQSRRRLDHQFGAQHSRDLDTVGDAVFSEVEREEIAQALTLLSDLQRDALLACYYRGLTHVQVSRELDVPLGTVKSRIRDAVGSMREILQNLP